MEGVGHVTQISGGNFTSRAERRRKLREVEEEKHRPKKRYNRELTWVEPMVHFQVHQVRKGLPQQQPVHGGLPPHVTVTVPRLAVPTTTVLQAELVHVL